MYMPRSNWFGSGHYDTSDSPRSCTGLLDANSWSENRPFSGHRDGIRLIWDRDWCWQCQPDSCICYTISVDRHCNLASPGALSRHFNRSVLPLWGRWSEVGFIGGPTSVTSSLAWSSCQRFHYREMSVLQEIYGVLTVHTVGVLGLRMDRWVIPTIYWPGRRSKLRMRQSFTGGSVTIRIQLLTRMLSLSHHSDVRLPEGPLQYYVSNSKCLLSVMAQWVFEDYRMQSIRDFNGEVLLGLCQVIVLAGPKGHIWGSFQGALLPYVFSNTLKFCLEQNQPCGVKLSTARVLHVLMANKDVVVAA